MPSFATQGDMGRLLGMGSKWLLSSWRDVQVFWGQLTKGATLELVTRFVRWIALSKWVSLVDACCMISPKNDIPHDGGVHLSFV